MAVQVTLAPGDVESVWAPPPVRSSPVSPDPRHRDAQIEFSTATVFREPEPARPCAWQRNRCCGGSTEDLPRLPHEEVQILEVMQAPMQVIDSVDLRKRGLRGGDLNPRPLGYEPNPTGPLRTARHCTSRFS